MKKQVLIGIAACLIAGLAWTSNDVAVAAQDDGPTPTQRLRLLEVKMANVEKLVGVKLDDNAAIAQLVREREEAMAMAKANSVVSQLQTIRSQLELYQIQHKGHYPDLARGWHQLVGETDSNGRLLKTGQPNRNGLGPYLRSPAINPITQSSKVITKREDVGQDAGWLYTPRTGEIKIVMPRAIAAATQMDPVNVVVY